MKVFLWFLTIFLVSLLFPYLIEKYSEFWRNANVEEVKRVKTRYGSNAKVDFRGYSSILVLSYIITMLSFLACVCCIGMYFVNMYFSK